MRREVGQVSGGRTRKGCVPGEGYNGLLEAGECRGCLAEKCDLSDLFRGALMGGREGGRGSAPAGRSPRAWATRGRDGPGGLVSTPQDTVRHRVGAG